MLIRRVRKNGEPSKLSMKGIVTTYEQKEDKLPVLVFGTEQVDL